MLVGVDVNPQRGQFGAILALARGRAGDAGGDPEIDCAAGIVPAPAVGFYERTIAGEQRPRRPRPALVGQRPDLYGVAGAGEELREKARSLAVVAVAHNSSSLDMKPG